MKSVHEGHKFPCPHCEYKATKNGNLQTHIKSVHEGQKFPCPQCDYKAAWKSIVQKHIKTDHENKKFLCTQCKYQATERGILKKHINSVHKGPEKFQGTHCEYIAARKDVNIEELYLEASQHVADLQVEVGKLEELWTAIR